MKLKSRIALIIATFVPVLGHSSTMTLNFAYTYISEDFSHYLSPNFSTDYTHSEQGGMPSSMSHASVASGFEGFPLSVSETSSAAISITGNSITVVGSASTSALSSATYAPPATEYAESSAGSGIEYNSTLPTILTVYWPLSESSLGLGSSSIYVNNTLLASSDPGNTFVTDLLPGINDVVFSSDSNSIRYPSPFGSFQNGDGSDSSASYKYTVRTVPGPGAALVFGLAIFVRRRRDGA